MKPPKTLKELHRALDKGELMEITTPIRTSPVTKDLFPNTSLVLVKTATFEKRLRSFQKTIDFVVSASLACKTAENSHKTSLSFNFDGWKVTISTKLYESPLGMLGVVFLAETITTPLAIVEEELPINKGRF